MLNLTSYFKNNKFRLILYFIGIIGLLILVGHIIYVQFYTNENILDEFGIKEKPFYLVNVAIVIAAIATAIFTWWKNNINERISLTQEVSRQDTLYAKAVEFLKDEALITQKGGIHILKDLVMISPGQTQKCIDMLCSLNESWMPKFLKEYPDFFEINRNFPNLKNPGEIKIKHYITKTEFSITEFESTKPFVKMIQLSQLVLQSLSHIFRHISDNDEYKGPFDLSYKFLCSIDLNKLDFKKKFILNSANFQSGDLIKTNLQSADLIKANFQFALLLNANLKSINLKVANLQFANLSGANLQFANLSGANLQSTNLVNANLQSTYLAIANLQSAKLIGANLQSSNLIRSDLQSANVSEANLQSADLSNANLQFTDLREANLQSADIEFANFLNAKLEKTDFRKAKNIDKAIFDDNKKDAIFTDEDYRKHYSDSTVSDTNVKN
jgi:uncharacterized protein YjbI with pentapeptide repeats